MKTKLKISAKALKMILEGNTRAFLCAALDVSYHTMNRWIRDNEPDSRLTTISALKVIEEQTGLKQSEILQYV
jgi:hypothetical protein